MPGELTLKNNVSVSTYQSMDGSNYTVGGFETKFKNDNVSFGGFGGIGSNFEGTNDAVFDIKASHNYNSTLNQNLRIRTKINGESGSVQIRYSPISFNAPISKTTNIYGNLHYSGQYKSNGQWKNSAGVFAGATQNLGKNVTVSLEAQRYNLQDFLDNSSSNWGVNAIVSFNF